MKYSEHIQWIIDNRNEALNQALLRDSSYQNTDNPFEVFLNSDPTSKKKLTQWIVDTYINDGFKWEDIQAGINSKVFDTLSLYIKHKSKIDASRDLKVNVNRDCKIITNDISRYDTLGNVYKDIAHFIKPDKSSRSIKRDEQAQAYEESDILVKSDSLTVVIPKTEYASKWWGRGTQWCTAGDKNNSFFSYYEDGPLIIIIVNGIKTQLHVHLINEDPLYHFQFMDEHDNLVKLNFIKSNWELLSPILEWAVSKNGVALEYIPKSLRTAELCLEAVRQNGNTLRHVPESLRTTELYLEAIRQDGRALYYIPKSLRTENLCLEAVKQNGEALRYVPKPLRTMELCIEALKNNGIALGGVPKNLITAELCLEAVINKGNSLAYVPKNLITPELCQEAVKQNSESLFSVPEHLINPELCMEAVRNNGNSLLYIPRPLRTAELCLEAVRQNGNALLYIPLALITPEILSCSKKDNINYDKNWNSDVIEELKLQLNISNALDNRINIK